MIHLVSLEKFMPYFFAHDLQNYARMTPVYLSDMHNLSSDDRLFIEKNFCVCKSDIPFISIGVDHALEQENKVTKVMGGITNLSIDDNKLEQFFMIKRQL